MPRPVAMIAATAIVLSATLGAVAPEPLTPVKASAQKLTLNSDQLTKLFTWAGSASGTTSTEFTLPAGSFPAVTESAIDIGVVAVARPTTPCFPAITKAKGTLTSGGYLVLEGSCFGAAGSVILGGFPNGDPKPTTEAWTPTAITVQLPTISGVPDLTMQIKVSTGGLLSRSINANYVAALGSPIALPGKDIVNNVCTLYGACSTYPLAPVGTHWDYSAQTGTDVWTLSIPDHFRLQAIDLVHITSAPTKTTTINAGSSKTTFSVAWSEKQNSTVTGTSSETQTTSCSFSFGNDLLDALTFDQAHANLFPGCTVTTTGGHPIQIPTYTNIYRVQPMVVGPLGMNP